MTETLDNMNAGTPERPTFLTVLCILTFIGSGLGVLGSLMGFMGSAALSYFAPQGTMISQVIGLAASVLCLYGAIKMCRIVEKENELEIQDLKYLPVGDDWSWTLIQIGEQTIKPNGNELYVSELKPKIQPYIISKKQADDFLHSLKIGEDFYSNLEQIIGRLEALSIIGDKRAWNILKDLEKYTGRKFDGALAETWKESVANIKWIQKQ